MNTKFRFRGSALCLGLVLAAALGVQALVAAEAKPVSPAVTVQLHHPIFGEICTSDAGLAGQVPGNILSNITATTLEQIVNLCPASHRSGLFTKIRQHDRSGDQVVTGRTYTLRAGESSEGDVVVIHGHARIDGVVNGDMVAVASRARFDAGAVVNGDFSSVVSAVEHEKDLQVNGSRYNLDFLPA